MIESCRNCTHLRNLWWWKNYPNDKQNGWCCNLFDNKKDDYTLMQLYSIDDLCECFDPKDKALYENVDRCVCCGEIIPEGCMICLKCEHEVS